MESALLELAGFKKPTMSVKVNEKKTIKLSSAASDVDEALITWLCWAGTIKSIPISDDVLKQKPVFFLREVQILKNFKTSDAMDGLGSRNLTSNNTDKNQPNTGS